MNRPPLCNDTGLGDMISPPEHPLKAIIAAAASAV
jgi:hypothetical protein